MAHTLLITGGARSGKSSYAQKVAERIQGPRTYVATCPHVDDEMEARIRKHQADRVGRGWCTIEEPIGLAHALGKQHSNVTLVDCLSLWVCNLMMEAEHSARPIGEADVASLTAEVIRVASECEGTVIFVTNEVGLGIVPDNPSARLYRDLLGRVNQIVAAAADTVVLMTCGLPLVLKGEGVDHDTH